MDVDDDSVMLFGMFLLCNVSVVFGHVEPAFLLEHPSDPADASKSAKGAMCSSLWVTQQLLAFRNYTGMRVYTFD